MKWMDEAFDYLCYSKVGMVVGWIWAATLFTALSMRVTIEIFGG